MSTQIPNGPPQLDDAFYARIASHFPGLESTSSLAPAASTSIQSTVNAPTHSAGAGSTASSSISSERSMSASKSHSKGALPAPGSTSATSMPATSTGYLHPVNGHRSTTSVYHPQPTRSGRVPVPPPEEELQAMLAMDNYFEFPSESESDDDDFVMPASEPNDDDDEQDDETPRNESMPSVPAAEHLGDYEEKWPTAIDSAEYDWLMENLKAVEHTASIPSPAAYPAFNESPNTLSHDKELTSASQTLDSVAEAGPSKQAAPRRTGDRNSSTQTACRSPATRSPIRATGPARARTRDTSGKLSSSVLSDLHTLPQPEQSHAGLDQEGNFGNSVQAPAENTRKGRTKSAATNKDAAGSNPPSKMASTDGSQHHLTGSKAAVEALDKLEYKRKRNAEQSRTFRERQRALREATADRIQQLEEENHHLRQELSSLRVRLQSLEGTSRSKAVAASEPTRKYSVTKNTSTTRSKRRKISEAPQSPTSPPAPCQPSQAPMTSLSFEDLGKFVAGFVQAKSHSDAANAPLAPPQDKSTHRAISPSEPPETPHPLMLLTQLLTSQTSQ